MIQVLGAGPQLLLLYCVAVQGSCKPYKRLPFRSRRLPWDVVWRELVIGFDDLPCPKP